MKIADGATRLVGIVGHPIAQVRAPQVWSAMFRLHGLNLLCVPMHVVPEDLAAFLAGLRPMRNLAGIIVTIPHKPAAVRHVDALTERARLVQSVNYIAIGADGGWTGDIVDGIGFVANLRAHAADPRGLRALVVGAGGVGTAIAFALAEAGIAELVLYDRDQARAQDVARRVAATGTPARVAPPDPAGFALVVNATPIGMRPDDLLPIDAGRIDPGAIVADVIVTPTLLLERAAARGCRTVAGTGMMEHQLAIMAGHLGVPHLDFSAATVRQVAATTEA